MRFAPAELAISFYFGDLHYSKLPGIAADALEFGFDGPSLRILAGLDHLIESDLDSRIVDCAFREMGVDAPIPKDVARLALARRSAARAFQDSNVIDEATHIRLYLCDVGQQVPPELKGIVRLSTELSRSPRGRWEELKRQLTLEMLNFLARAAKG